MSDKIQAFGSTINHPRLHFVVLIWVNSIIIRNDYDYVYGQQSIPPGLCPKSP